MPTFNQMLHLQYRKPKGRYSRTWTGLRGSPQRRGTCLQVFWTTPKKPNSANRRVTKVLLSTAKRIIAHIPGIGHTLKRHSTVLIRGGRVKDLPGMKYRVIRGVADLEGLTLRRCGRSKYGCKAFKITVQ